MAGLEPREFGAFFEALWGYGPLPWQVRLVDRVCKGDWPAFVDLPTASGKTACLDVAVFSLAVQASLGPEQRTVGRRTFFVVNRRVIVDEAYKRALQLATRLHRADSNAPDSILRRVADALHRISGDANSPPLDVALVRGGIVRDNRWARSITQPIIVTSTIDQVGSRLLFRGYGVSPESAPIHAALIAHDSTILLDEAHVSQPFVETLDAVTRYRADRWAESHFRTPFRFVQMTATPGDNMGDVFRLAEEDHRHPTLIARHGRPKGVRLEVAERAKGKRAVQELAAQLVAQAVELQDNRPANVAIVVNRIATARAVYDRLRAHFNATDEDGQSTAIIYLAIGRMRPIDRDEVTRAIEQRVGAGSPGTDENSKPMFVVATQCIEVGADFDFDVMVCECASLDALRQRFGRLNRAGRPIDARGCIVVRADQIEGDDPVYGSALATTWQWLASVASSGHVDFSVNAVDALLKGVSTAPLFAPRDRAPVLLPAYLDAWVQTHPYPEPDPDVSLFLHGPHKGDPDVSVCWRDDLPDGEDEESLIATVSLCPPSAPECMPVPVSAVRRWLAGSSIAEERKADEQRSDMLDSPPPLQTDERVTSRPRKAVLWRGTDRSRLLGDPRELRPGDTVVLPVTQNPDEDGRSVFGHIPPAARIDVAEAAFRQSRGRAMLRLRAEQLAHWPACDAVTRLQEWISDPESDLRRDALRALLKEAADAITTDCELQETLWNLADKAHGLEDERYPAGNGVVLRTRRRLPVATPLTLLPAIDDGEDETSRVDRDTPVPLDGHLLHVRQEVDAALGLLDVGCWTEAIQRAAELHDVGKADERFQAMLLNCDCQDVWAQPKLWAKSARMPASRQERAHARQRSGLPEGFRHEMLSAQLADLAEGDVPADNVARALTLHLIASHHGRARPFAPIVMDDEPPDISLRALGMSASLDRDNRRERPPHRIDSGFAERFWLLTRRFGWWGLAYLESLLRLADQRASLREEVGIFDDAVRPVISETAT